MAHYSFSTTIMGIYVITLNIFYRKCFSAVEYHYHQW